MTLATKDRITFYSSPNLKVWTKESEFVKSWVHTVGFGNALIFFRLSLTEKIIGCSWVSINPGGPSGGSATQYFTGNFDGKRFTPDSEKQKGWIMELIIMLA